MAHLLSATRMTGLAPEWAPVEAVPPLNFRQAVTARDDPLKPLGHVPSDLTLFHQLADAMPQLVSIMQADASRTYVNQRWADYTGVAREDILQNRWGRFIHPDDLPQVMATWARATAAGVTAELEYRLLRADGQYRWMLGRAVPLKAEAGMAGDWLVTSTDIDELKSTAVQLEKSIAMKRLAGRVARLGGWAIELPDQVLTWSDENCMIHDAPPGYQPTLDEGISYFLPEHQGLVKQYVQACAIHGTAYDFVLPKYTMAHRLIWVRSIGEAVRDASGQIIRIQGAFQDVTEQKEAEARTRALEQEVLCLSQSLNTELERRVELRTAQLARANHELESFAYAVSHDLRSPLNTIAGFIQLLLKADGAQVSAKGHHYLGRIAAGANQMGDLIAGLLTLAHLSREEPKLETVDLSAMAQRLALHGQRLQPSRQAQLRVQPGLQVQGDPRLLEVVLHNLLD
ncbi:MAG: sensor histidine kinase, partial [Polaromonas sp.]